MDEAIELLRTRALGPFALGSTYAEVIGRAGPPEDRSANDDIWKYGDVEITFVEGAVCMVGLYPRDPAGRMAREAFLSAAATAGIGLRPDPYLSFPLDQRAYLSDADVSAVFDREDRLAKVIAAA